MLSYRHSFHAGNFADVHKHLILQQLLAALARKPTPFFVLDTHAGAGLYELRDAQAQKLKEYEHGAGKLCLASHLPAECAPLLKAIRSLNPRGDLFLYPGSAWLIAQALRLGDRAAFAELHSSDFPKLQANLQGFAGVSVVQGDGFAAIKALFPPSEKRGLLFMDPPYERDEDWEQVIHAVKLAYTRFRQGIIAIWYPCLPGRAVERFLNRLRALAIPKTGIAEIYVAPSARRGMFGSGMALINPPWGVFESLADWMPALSDLLAQAPGPTWRVEWLVPEAGRPR